jgi:adenosylcobinamide-GDP ribazoletransferase
VKAPPSPHGNWLDGARAALGLLTVVGGSAPATPASVPWFPVVGAGLGGALGTLWWVLDEVMPPFVAASVVAAADLGLTGMLHFDGLIDAADGLLPHLDRDERLAVMAEPQVGAFGVTAACALLAMRVAALGSVGRRPLWDRVLLLSALLATSRATMALAALHLPYARKSGMASGYGAAESPAGRAQPARTLSCLVAAAVPALGLGAWHRRAAPAVLAAEAGAAGAVFALARRKLGGYTGDVLGAAGVVAETAGLIVAAAKWW